MVTDYLKSSSIQVLSVMIDCPGDSKQLAFQVTVSRFCINQFKLLDEKLSGLPSWSIHAPRLFWLASHSITISFCGSKYCNTVLSLTSAFSASSNLVCVSSHTNSAFFFTRARRSCVLAARLGIKFPR